MDRQWPINPLCIRRLTYRRSQESDWTSAKLNQRSKVDCWRTPRVTSPSTDGCVYLAAKPAIINKQSKEDDRTDLVDEKEIKQEPANHPELKLAIDNEPENDANNHESSPIPATAPSSTVICYQLSSDTGASAVATNTKHSNGHSSSGANNNADAVKRRKDDDGCRIGPDEIEVSKCTEAMN